MQDWLPSKEWLLRVVIATFGFHLLGLTFTQNMGLAILLTLVAVSRRFDA